MKVPFNKPVSEFFDASTIGGLRKFCGDGPYTAECSSMISKKFGITQTLLTTSCTHALEMAAILLDIGPGDEVIMPSFTFVSTANAFVLRGATIVFVDIRKDTLNLDERLVESAVTPRTRAIVPVHYAGVACDMDAILDIATRHKLFVVEDAAQGVMARYKGKQLGSLGQMGAFSFHETKNYHCGEGGALLINSEDFCQRAEIIREKGTNRSRFFRGQVDKYTWVDKGSSYLPSELNAAYLLGQLENLEKINEDRLKTWNLYFESLRNLAWSERLVLPFVPPDCEHNAHMFQIRLKDINERTRLIDYLKSKGIQTAFHYVPLHSSPAGRTFGRFHGTDHYTSKESDRLLRLPMWYGLPEGDTLFVCEAISSYFRQA